jgi:LmbE family N-acetylglucosaminyl deacetylase
MNQTGNSTTTPGKRDPRLPPRQEAGVRLALKLGLRTLLICAGIVPTLFGQQPLAEDRGSVGLAQSLRRLQTTGRIVYMIAHPDDEDGGTITMLTRGRGYTVTLLALSRGEAAGDAVSSDFGPPLGIRRTIELIRSSEYYGARLRISRFLDFGLSKTLAKTWRYWDQEAALRDMVRFIRQERPHVVVSRWQGNAGDRLGNHEADGIIAQRAFEAAGDPTRFPEQIAEGLDPWQPLKLYTDNRTESDDWTIKVDSAVYDPLLGRTYGQIAHEGLGQQVSQAAVGPIIPVDWPSVSYYKLDRSRVGMADKESDFFEHIDVTLKGYPELEKHVGEAVAAFDVQHPEACVAPLARALKTVRQLASSGRESLNLSIKEQQLQTALAQALGFQFEALVEPNKPGRNFGEYKGVRTPITFSPGDSFRVLVNFRASPDRNVGTTEIKLLAPDGWKIRTLAPNRFEVTIPLNASLTSAFWIRDSTGDGFYRITRPEVLGAPITPSPLQAKLTYRIDGVEGSVSADVQTSSVNTLGVQLRHSVAVASRVSVRFQPEALALPLGRSRYDVICSVRNFGVGPNEGTLRLELPLGWSSDPSSVPYSFQRQGEQADLLFHVIPSSNFGDAEYHIQAVAESGGETYRNSFVPVTEPGLDTVYMEEPARVTLHPVDVQIPHVRVGYVMGTGDDVPAALRLLGVDVDLLDRDTLALGHLSRYNTIVLGVRAYLAREDLRTYNWRLLDYVKNGGVLVVQYNTEEFDSNNYGPYAYSEAGAAQDVTEEDSPIEVLEPNNPILNYPNKIGPKDFDGWLEKRGLRFPPSWDERYVPVLSTHDRGQKPQAGGLLVARYGRGLYLYNGYALYRQISLAVPGGVRLFANFLALGLPDAVWRK